MFETVTVDEALKKGRRIISLPATLIMLGCIGGALFLLLHFRFPPWVLTMGFALAFVFSWLYRGMMSMKWRLWAFDNVRNVHELKKKAIKSNLMWDDGSFFDKVVFKTRAQKDKWLSLQSKFNQADLFLEDHNIQAQTLIYYSRKKGLRDLIWIVPCMILGLYLLIFSKVPLFAIGVMIIPGLYLYIDYRLIKNRKPQIALSKNGMETATTPFYEWKDIKGEKVNIERMGNSSTWRFLVYDYPGGSERLQIDNFDINTKELEHLMEVYRGRSENSR